MGNIYFVPISEIQKVRKNVTDPVVSSEILANIFRVNTLSMIAQAGSGHLGTSFSSMDIMVWLWTQEMVSPNDNKPESDIFFSSKGHDAPALYSLLIGLGKLDFNLIHKLRRLNGLPGHPDVITPYIMTNTGPLGMGISKARGMVIANRLNGRKNHIYVLSGDGELQEGQVWESLQSAVNGNFGEITLVVDHNKIQSDTWVKTTSDLGRIEEKFKSFGWEVKRCDGHDFEQLKRVFSHFKTVTDKPKVLIADTVKGKGVSLMEKFDGSLYKFHSGAPTAEVYKIAFDELAGQVNDKLKNLGQEPLELISVEVPERKVLENSGKLIPAYGDELIKIARKNPNVVVLDADLVLDCGLAPFKNEFPERFVECGIAEQDMVSVAGGLALRGKIPIVHSFACFLTTRPNEQIYNNATEKKKIIYIGSLSGLLPSQSGHSHQSVRDISVLGSIPGLTLIEPSCEKETRLALNWAINENPLSTYIRLISIPYEINFFLPESYELAKGRGVKLVAGQKTAIFAYGPVMLNQAVAARNVLEKNYNMEVAVYNLPWLNEIDEEWLSKEIKDYENIITIDDHYVKFGQGMLISNLIARSESKKNVYNFGLETIPACGINSEVLEFHKLDSGSLTERIKNIVGA